MITRTKILLLLIISFLFQSCSHYYYAPNQANILKLSDQNDIKISVSGNETNGNYTLKHRNIQIGYSPIKHLGVFASHFKMSGDDSATGTVATRAGVGHLNNIAVGGYYLIETGSLLDRLVNYDENLGVTSGVLFDVYGGYGKGHVYNQYWDGGQTDLDFQKYFIQGGVHWQGKAIGLSYVMKAGRLNYFNGIAMGKLDDANIKAFQNIETIRDFPFRETSFQFYMGVKYARVYVNVSTVVSDFDNKFSHRSNVGSFGIVMEIDEIFRVIKNNKSYE